MLARNMRQTRTDTETIVAHIRLPKELEAVPKLVITDS